MADRSTGRLVRRQAAERQTGGKHACDEEVSRKCVSQCVCVLVGWSDCVQVHVKVKRKCNGVEWSVCSCGAGNSREIRRYKTRGEGKKMGMIDDGR